MFCVLDQGILRRSIDFLDQQVTRVGEKLHSRFIYFLAPRARYYMARLVGIRILIAVVTI